MKSYVPIITSTNYWQFQFLERLDSSLPTKSQQNILTVPDCNVSASLILSTQVSRKIHGSQHSCTTLLHWFVVLFFWTWCDYLIPPTTNCFSCNLETKVIIFCTCVNFCGWFVMKNPPRAHLHFGLLSCPSRVIA